MLFLLVNPGLALPLDKLGSCLGRWAKKSVKHTIVWFRKWRTYI